MPELKNIQFEGKLRVDSINIMLRNDTARNVGVKCDVTVAGLPTGYGALDFNFEPDEELIEFLHKKINAAIEEGKIGKSMPYLKKIEEKKK